MLQSKSEVVSYINGLEGYSGYVQFSHRPFMIEKDLFIDKSPQIEDEKGFVFEAHFIKGTDSVMIRQSNDGWFVDTTPNVPLDEIETYHGLGDIKINMAQIWIEKEDAECAGMIVKHLEKVVFAGFANQGGKS